MSDVAFVHRVKQIEGDLVITSADLLCDPDALPSSFKNAFYKSSNFILYAESQIPFAFGMNQEVLNGLDDYNENNLADVHSKKLSWQDELDTYIQSQAYTHISNDDAVPLFNYVDPKVSLTSYIDNWISCLDHKLDQRSKLFKSQTEPLHIKAYARVGLMGNPSDGFYGKIKKGWKGEILIEILT